MPGEILQLTQPNVQTPSTPTSQRLRDDVADLMCRESEIIVSTIVCTENLSSGVVVVKSAKDGV
jgi:hypothetical protein